MTSAIEPTVKSPRVISRAIKNPGWQIAGLLVIAVTIGAVTSSAFFTEVNIYSLLQSSIAPLLVALGVSIALYAGLPDLSIGSVVGASAMSYAALEQHLQSPVLSSVIAVAGGLLVGLLNSTAVVNFNVDPIVATLGTLAGLRGVIYVLGGNQSQVAVNPFFQELSLQRVGPIPVAFIVLICLYIVVSIYIAKSRIGRHIQAVGGNDDAAARAGIPVGIIKRVLLLLTAGLSALAGLIYVGQLYSAPLTLGFGFELQIYAAILISGFSLTSGGIGNPMVTVAGLLLLAVITNVLDLNNIPSGWQDVVTGVLVAAAVTLDVVRRRERFH